MNEAESNRPSPGPKCVERASGALILGCVAAALAMWLFINLADEVMESATQQFDSRIVLFFHNHASHTLHVFMAGVTWIAGGPSQAVLIVGVALFLWLRRRRWPEPVTMLVAGFGGMLLDDGLKRIFHRVRPEPVFYHLGYSFPSGHSFSAVTVYGLIAYLVSRELPSRLRILVWIVAIVWILLVGFSRVYLQQHYPTDVLGGYLAGGCWLWACVTWLSELRRRGAPNEDEPAQSAHV
jgi:undecaprenyl-diphosphatase